jgi:hypothetical protein
LDKVYIAFGICDDFIINMINLISKQVFHNTLITLHRLWSIIKTNICWQSAWRFVFEKTAEPLQCLYIVKERLNSSVLSSRLNADNDGREVADGFRLWRQRSMQLMSTLYSGRSRLVRLSMATAWPWCLFWFLMLSRFYFQLSRLCQIIRFAGPVVTKSLVSAYVLSSLDNCNAALAGLPRRRCDLINICTDMLCLSPFEENCHFVSH